MFLSLTKAVQMMKNEQKICLPQYFWCAKELISKNKQTKKTTFQ